MGATGVSIHQSQRSVERRWAIGLFRLVRQFLLFRPEGHVLQWLQSREIGAHQIGEVRTDFYHHIFSRNHLPLTSVELKKGIC